MENLNSAVETLIHGANTLFILMGAIMVLAMHAGFAFLEVGTVRQKNQVNALSKIISDFAISCLAYFFVGYWIAYGATFFADAATLSRVVAAGFNQRRKMLRASLRGLAPDIEDRIRAAGLVPTQRAEEVSLEGFCALAREVAR